MPRFVLLYHDCPPTYERPSHWDFMLESGDKLRTWALAQLPRDWQATHARTRESFPDCPPLADTNEVIAQQLADHRCDYLELEGDLTNNRGRVIRVEEGSYETLAESASSLEIALANGAESHRAKLTRRGGDDAKWDLLLTVRSPQRNSFFHHRP